MAPFQTFGILVQWEIVWPLWFHNNELLEQWHVTRLTKIIIKLAKIFSL